MAGRACGPHVRSRRRRGGVMMTVKQLIDRLQRVNRKNKEVVVYVSSLKDDITLDDWCDTFQVDDVELEDDFAVSIEVSSQKEYFKSHKGVS